LHSIIITAGYLIGLLKSSKAEELRIVDALCEALCQGNAGGIAPTSTPSESATKTQRKGIECTEIELENRWLKSIISLHNP
jgi:hypothetical protein